MRPAVVLSPGAPAPGRPFTAPERTADDLRALAAVREAMCRRLRGTPSGSLDDHWVAADGAEHWLVVPDARRLAAARPAVAIGFFGQARDDVDHEPIGRLERDLLRRAAGFVGLLAYHNVRFATGRWGNLVVFAADADPAHVAGDAVHAVAVARTPRHYRSLRLHRAELPDGALGERALELRRTALYDFDESPPWRAVRAA